MRSLIYNLLYFILFFILYQLNLIFAILLVYAHHQVALTGIKLLDHDILVGTDGVYLIMKNDPFSYQITN